MCKRPNTKTHFLKPMGASYFDARYSSGVVKVYPYRSIIPEVEAVSKCVYRFADCVKYLLNRGPEREVPRHSHIVFGVVVRVCYGRYFASDFRFMTPKGICLNGGALPRWLDMLPFLLERN